MVGSPLLSLINMDTLEMSKCPPVYYIIITYVHTMQAAVDNYIIFLHYTFTSSLGVNNGLFREESNETEEVSINQYNII